MPIPSSSDPFLSLKRALMVDDDRIQKMEDYCQEQRVFQKFEVSAPERRRRANITSVATCR